MVTNVFNAVSGPVNAGAPSPLVQQLARHADTNGDGQVSTGEFTQFLANMLNQPAAANTDTASAKDTISRILSSHAVTPAGLRGALDAIQQALPGTSLQGADTLNIPGLGSVKVGQFTGANGAGWCWKPADVVVR